MSGTANQSRQGPKEGTPDRLGRYRLVSELGRGAMGVVYRARDPVIEREVAVKTIRVDLPREELALFEARFFTEIRAAGRLSHPNIVTVHDAGREGGLLYVTMELLEGPSLADLLAAQAALPPAAIASIGAQVADALAYAHAQGIVHRDVKPANIIVVRDRIPKLTDFGVARLPSEASTLSGTLIGSPKYMSPEQVNAQAVDGRSDVFSLGAVLYELLTGEAAFGAEDMHTVMHRVATHVPPPPATLNPRVPAALDRIVCRAIAKRPEDRYPSARALAADLKRFVRGEPVVVDAAGPAPAPARPVSAGDETVVLPPRAAAPAATREARQGARRRALAGVAVGAVLAALAGAWALHGSDTARDAPSPVATIAAAPRIENAAAAPVPEAAQAHVPAPAAPAPSPASPKAAAEPRAIDAPVARRIAGAAPAPGKATRAAPAAPPPRAPEAKVMLAIAPWGEVYVDGQRMGVAPPLNELTVPAGRRKIEIRNADLKPHVVMLDLRADSAVKIKHQFR
ncbi:MAG: serine/threonine protein kinase [Burkholderiales bacterium]|nr:serine/threonine protein kinase [Burkholderiales bacterium]